MHWAKTTRTRFVRTNARILCTQIDIVAAAGTRRRSRCRNRGRTRTSAGACTPCQTTAGAPSGATPNSRCRCRRRRINTIAIAACILGKNGVKSSHIARLPPNDDSTGANQGTVVESRAGGRCACCAVLGHHRRVFLPEDAVALCVWRNPAIRIHMHNNQRCWCVHPLYMQAINQHPPYPVFFTPRTQLDFWSGILHYSICV